MHHDIDAEFRGQALQVDLPQPQARSVLPPSAVMVNRVAKG
jgi:hypothetical protein